MSLAQPAAGRQLRHGWQRADAGRTAIMLVLLAGAVLLVVFQYPIRHLEAVLASHLFTGGTLTSYVGTDDTIVFLIPSETRGFALQISPECTSAFLIAPFLVVAAMLLLRRRFPPERVVLGALVAAVLLVLANQLRVGAIAGLILMWGLDRGYQLGHLVVGSLISIVFIAMGAFALVTVVVSGRAPGRHRAA